MQFVPAMPACHHCKGTLPASSGKRCLLAAVLYIISLYFCPIPLLSSAAYIYRFTSGEFDVASRALPLLTRTHPCPYSRMKTQEAIKQYRHDWGIKGEPAHRKITPVIDRILSRPSDPAIRSSRPVTSEVYELTCNLSRPTNKSLAHPHTAGHSGLPLACRRSTVCNNNVA